MGRPDLTEQRTSEILDAFERCVARLGLDGSSLDKVAEEAGVKRQLIRHYIGNRDDLVRAFAERLIEKYHAQLAWMIDALPATGRVDALFGYLFPSAAAYSAESTLVLEAMIAAADRMPEFRDLLATYIEALTASIAGELRRAYPSASRADAAAVAYGIVGLCFNQESLAPLALPPRYLRASRECARRLAASLAG